MASCHLAFVNHVVWLLHLPGVGGWIVAPTPGPAYSRLGSHGSLCVPATLCPVGFSGIKLLQERKTHLIHLGLQGQICIALSPLVFYLSLRTSCLCPTKEWVKERNGTRIQDEKNEKSSQWLMFWDKCQGYQTFLFGGELKKKSKAIPFC